MYAPVLVTPPAAEPVTLEEAKAHLVVTFDDDDALIGSFVQSATAYLDGWEGILGRALVTQTWRQDFDCFARILRLPLAPAQSIASVKWRNPEGQIATVAAESYRLLADGRGPYVRFKDSFVFPAPLNEVAAVNVEFVAGYGDPADVPAAIRQAILQTVGHWYANREAVVTGTIATTLPMMAESLLAPYRRD